MRQRKAKSRKADRIMGNPQKRDSEAPQGESQVFPAEPISDGLGSEPRTVTIKDAPAHCKASCPNCGDDLVETGCKRRCLRPGCRYFDDCSNLL